MRYHVTYAHSFSYLSALIVSSFLLFFQFLVPRNWILFLLSFFLSPTSFYLTTIRCRGVITHDHTQGHTTVSRTPLDEGSIRRRDLYLITHNTYNTQTSIPPTGFEPSIPAGDQPNILVLHRSATGIGWLSFSLANFSVHSINIVISLTRFP